VEENCLKENIVSIYGYGYGTNDGQNALDWNYYRYGTGGRPLDYPAHLPWPPPQSTQGSGSDYETPPVPEDKRSDWDKWYDYVDEGKFGVADRTLTQGLRAFPMAGSLIYNETERDMGIPNNRAGIGGLFMGIPGDSLEGYLRGDPENQYGPSYKGPGHRLTSTDPSLSQEQKDRTYNMMLGLTPGQSITDSRRGMGVTREVGDYLDSLNNYKAANYKLENTPMNTLSWEAEQHAASKGQLGLRDSQKELEQLQEQVNQAKGINALATGRDNFGIQDPSIQDWAQKEIGIASLDNNLATSPDTSGGSLVTNGYSNNLGANAPAVVDPVTGYRNAPGPGYDSWTDPMTGNTYHGAGYDWNNDSGNDGSTDQTGGGGYNDDYGDGGPDADGTWD
jgi:hypothetical protein